MSVQPKKKSEETRTRILDAALAVFRERGFQPATMREIAAKAGVAVGAAYYYFDSKDAIVMAFYERAQSEMTPASVARLASCRTLEERLRALISLKLEYFADNRQLLASLTEHTDPEHPLSPFSRQTAPIREQDLELFAQAVAASEVRLPARIAPYLPRLLWLYQMGLILYWVCDHSEGQRRTEVLYDKSLKLILLALRFAWIPMLLPFQGLVAELLEAVFEPVGTPERSELRAAE
jgi:AcrR family transcriptional regulator